MNYLVFDLEFNQGFNFKKENISTINPKCPFEIIDIGAIKLDEDLNTISTFDRLIKPSVYKRLHPFVKNMTGISKESLKAAEVFNEVYKELRRFITDVDILCVWGTADIKELIRNIEYHKLDASIVPKKYINLQQYASHQLKAPGGNSVGLANAARLMNIPIETQLHKAINDAYYTAEIFKKISNINMQPKIYNFDDNNKLKTQGNKKSILDVNKLFAQFEKMFGRKMTNEEKIIIKLAYKMGSSKQFQKQEI
jgi:inhibitor of KinA sporulation pathway (predicted exonuclease)